MTPSFRSGKFVVATPGRSVCDDNARVLHQVNRLRFLALATRNGAAGVPSNVTRLNPAMGLAIYAAARTLSNYKGESFRFAQHPRFSKWVLSKLVPGDHILSSYGYVNECFEWVRAHGGKTFLDGGNSHPANFWEILSEEHRLWKCPFPPVARHHYERSLAMMEHVDYVLAPSNYVTQSFLTRGFRPEQMLTNVYPVNLANFAPPDAPRPADRPFTIINTGSLSLRKGTPYLLEAFRIIRQKIPNARLLLTRALADSIVPVMEKYRDLPIEWAPSLPHRELAERLRSADLYILPSLEEGLARTGLEALACGLPVIVTANTGINEFLTPGISGTVVPMRDPAAIADAAFQWWERIQEKRDEAPQVLLDANIFSFSHFADVFLGHLKNLALEDKEDGTGVGFPGRLLPAAVRANFVVATPARPPQDVYARVLAANHLLRLHVHGTRQPSQGVPLQLTRMNPVFGALGFCTGKFFPTYRGESLRFALNPSFDAWARRQLQPGDNVISSYGYANGCFQWAKDHGGHAILDAGNSHPEQFWQIIAEEHTARGISQPPVAAHYQERALEAVALADYVIAVSRYVRDSFIERGFPSDRILMLPRPINLQTFHPSPLPRPRDRPPTFICTGAMNFRKGSAYTLEAMSLIYKQLPNARFLLTDAVSESFLPTLARYRHLPIDWAVTLPHAQLAERLRSADVFLLLSLEEGMARTGVEALCCGLPVVVTANTGVGDLITPGHNGQVVPLRDPTAAAQAALHFWERIEKGERFVPGDLQTRLSQEHFESSFLNFLTQHDLI